MCSSMTGRCRIVCVSFTLSLGAVVAISQHAFPGMHVREHAFRNMHSWQHAFPNVHFPICIPVNMHFVICILGACDMHFGFRALC